MLQPCYLEQRCLLSTVLCCLQCSGECKDDSMVCQSACKQERKQRVGAQASVDALNFGV